MTLGDTPGGRIGFIGVLGNRYQQGDVFSIK
jgi:hypothetical protein